MEDRIRRLERLARAGDYYVRQRWKSALAAAGFPDPDESEISAPLTDAEDSQEAYDDVWWHRKTGLRWFGWLTDGGCPRGGTLKAHHKWGHHRWNGKNSKRKTLRTHRDGSRKSYRLRASSAGSA